MPTPPPATPTTSSTSTDALKGAFNAADSQFPPTPVGSASTPCPLAAATPDIPPKCAYLKHAPNAKAPAGSYIQMRSKSKPPKVSAPTNTDVTWPGDSTPSPAHTQTVTMADGQKIDVITPADSSGNTPDADAVAKSLQAVPPDQRAGLKQVVVSPKPSPEQSQVKDGTILGDTQSGVTNLYPVDVKPNTPTLDDRMMHETGHTYHPNFWKSGDDVKAWKAGAAADCNSPSDYGDSRTDEDFCEFSILYNAANGGPCDKALHDLYPNRCKMMDDYKKSQQK